MIKETSLTIFLTSGVNIKIKQGDKVTINNECITLEELAERLGDAIANKHGIKFVHEINHKYKEEDAEGTQTIKHICYIPYERLSWFLIEEV